MGGKTGPKGDTGATGHSGGTGHTGATATGGKTGPKGGTGSTGHSGGTGRRRLLPVRRARWSRARFGRPSALRARHMVIEIISIAGLATVQDGGRPGHMHDGVPPGGPLVPELLGRANAAARNAPSEAAIEAFGAITLVARAPVVLASDDGEARHFRRGRNVRASPRKDCGAVHCSARRRSFQLQGLASHSGCGPGRYAGHAALPRASVGSAQGILRGVDVADDRVGTGHQPGYVCLKLGGKLGRRPRERTIRTPE